MGGEGKEKQKRDNRGDRMKSTNPLALGVGGHMTTRGQQWLHPGAKESELKERNGLRRELRDKG
jgi:hypothetical protein